MKKISSEEPEKFIQSNLAVPKVIYFTDKTKTPLTIKALANSFKDKLIIGIASGKNHTLADLYGIKKFP